MNNRKRKVNCHPITGKSNSEAGFPPLVYGMLLVAYPDERSAYLTGRTLRDIEQRRQVNLLLKVPYGGEDWLWRD